MTVRWRPASHFVVMVIVLSVVKERLAMLGGQQT